VTPEGWVAIGAGLWAAARLVVAAWAVAAGLSAALRTVRRPAARRSNERLAVPGRGGREQLGRIIAGAASRGFYRSLLAERLRASARDELAIERGLSDEEALVELRRGAPLADPATMACLFEDHLAVHPRAAGRRRKSDDTEPDFLERAGRLLAVLEEPDATEGRNVRP